MKTALWITGIVVVIFIIMYFAFVINIDTSEPEIVTIGAPIHIVGLEIKTSDKAINRDIEKVSKRFNAIKKIHPVSTLKEPWASVNISKDYVEEQGTFTYVMGDVVTKVENIPEGLRHYEIPALTYAVFTIQPKSMFAWGLTMGRMKHFIYNDWLPGSPYEPSDLLGDFELHDDRSLGKHPQISLYVALK